MKKNKTVAVAVIILACSLILFLGLYLKIIRIEKNEGGISLSQSPEKLVPADRPGRCKATTETRHLMEMPENRQAPSPNTRDSALRQNNNPADENAFNVNHLKLIDIETDVEGERSAVILNDATGRQEYYRTGDVIEKATIVEISNDQAILAYQRKFFPLSIDKSNEASLDGVADQTPSDELKPPLYINEAEMQKAWEETQELMTQISMDQHLAGQEPKGVIVSRVNAGSVFEGIGLKPGDIIIRVDDMEMNIADDALEIYNSLRTKDTVHFTVIRQGDPDPIILIYNR